MTQETRVLFRESDGDDRYYKATITLLDTMAELGFQGNYYKLARRISRRLNRKENEVSPIFIVVTATSRAFGGYEESGWWYDVVTIEEVRKVWDWRSARKMLRELREDYPQPRFNRYSCANRGECDYDYVLCSSPEEFPSETTEKPTYE